MASLDFFANDTHTGTMHYLEFEKPLYDLEAKLSELQRLGRKEGVAIGKDVTRLQGKIAHFLKQTYAQLDPWQKVQVARHPDRPHTVDYIKHLLHDFTPLAGDKRFGDDAALIGGMGRFRGRSVCLLGHEKGYDSATRVHHNFGMPRPEGYRKAIRLMELADRFSLPIITLVDTPGAYPGVDAEQRGQAEAIAASIAHCLEVNVPIVSIVIGEGGSGGAIAIATANRVTMLEHAVYSVISPEGCSSILWRSKERARDAARAMKMTAQDLLAMNLIDDIIAEPIGGAHRDKNETIHKVGNAIEQSLESLIGSDITSFRQHRHDKFMAMGNQFLLTP